MNLLANEQRPKNLNDIFGQQHLVGENKVLYNLVKNKKIFSMILYGKPGIGKTSIANALVNELNINYRFLNATINNKSVPCCFVSRDQAGGGTSDGWCLELTLILNQE